MTGDSTGEIDFRVFWGKARPRGEASANSHPLAWHGLDVAASFDRILMLWPDQAVALTSAFEGPAEATLLSLSVLVALHDIGKFARSFQAKVHPAFPDCLGTWTPPAPCSHPMIGYGLAEDERHLVSFIQALIGPDNDMRREVLLGPVFGHHGRPVVPQAAHLDDHMGPPDRPAARAARAYARAVRDLFGSPTLPPLMRERAATFSWRFAGIVALADWIGSNQEHFSYTSADVDLATYWMDFARPRAEAAIAASGLTPAAPSQRRSLEIVCRPEFAPTEAQLWAETVPLPPEGGLFILEDVMGSGKTEAALILAHRLMQAGRAGGIYVALPTMATANALYHRMAKVYRALFTAAARPSLVLAHGARDLNDMFRNSLEFGERTAETEPGYSDDPADDTASAACARWLADDRRKTFLADVGVGTIDQALLAILPVKHACIRQLGLARRVLVIDEAHAYDAYMQGELEALVAHQARLGAPVIVLSATLPRLVRQRLAAAFAKGAGHPAAKLSGTAYPLATALGTEAEETELATRPDLVRTLSVSRCPDGTAAEAMVTAAAQQGAAVAYIRNSVDDAVATAERLRAEGLSVDLFHARFAMGDRLAIENRVVARFGREGTPDDRRGRVLVATQVAEQSLDFDVDLMVTDLAPVDLMLQRAGRLWRHPRDERGWPRPDLVVVAPEPADEAGADWYAAAFPRGRWVYPNHALLWLSARDLLARKTIEVPDDLRRLVDAVYAAEALDRAPAALWASANQAIGKDRAGRTMAGLNVLNLEKGYQPQSGEWGPDTVTPTRLGDERSLVRLARIVDRRLVPWIDASDPRRAWALSEVSVRRSRFAGRDGLSADIEAQAAVLDARWDESGIPAVALPLTAESDGWRFGYRNLRTAHGSGAYSPMIGLRWD